MWKRVLLPTGFFLSSLVLSGCDFTDQLSEGKLQFGNVVFQLTGEAATEREPAAAQARTPVHSGALPHIVKMQVENVKAGWGTCDETRAQTLQKTYKKATADLQEVWVAVASGERIEKLRVHRRPVNLFRLASEVSEILSQASIPAGEYKEVQVMLSGGTLVDHNGKSWPLTIPNGERNGVRIQLERNLFIDDQGEKARVSLNFCTDSNFILEAQDKPNRKFEFHPVIDKVANLTL